MYHQVNKTGQHGVMGALRRRGPFLRPWRRLLDWLLREIRIGEPSFERKPLVRVQFVERDAHPQPRLGINHLTVGLELRLSVANGYTHLGICFEGKHRIDKATARTEVGRAGRKPRPRTLLHDVGSRRKQMTIHSSAFGTGRSARLYLYIVSRVRLLATLTHRFDHPCIRAFQLYCRQLLRSAGWHAGTRPLSLPPRTPYKLYPCAHAQSKTANRRLSSA